VLVVLAVAKNVVAKVAIESGVSVVMGTPLSMKHFSFSILNSDVHIKDLRLQNPKGFEEKNMITMPEIYVDYVLGSILKGAPHVQEMRINLDKVYVVKNARGELNLDALKPMQVDSKEKAEKEEPLELQIDYVNLKVGGAVYQDYSKGGEPSVKEFNLNIDETIENVGSVNTLVRIIMLKVLYGTTLGKLVDIDLKGLQGNVSDALASSKELAMEAAAQAQEKAKAVAEKGEEMVQQGQEKAKELQEATGKKLEESSEAAKEAAQKTKEAASETADKLKGKLGGFAAKLKDLKKE